MPEYHIAIEALLDKIRNGDETTRLVALLLLRPFGELASPATPTLIHLLTERDANREITLMSRSYWKDSDVIAGNAEFRRQFPQVTDPGKTSAIAQSVRVLGVIGAAAERQAIRHLVEFLRGPSTDEGRKQAAIVALGEFGLKAAEAIPILVEVARSRTRFASCGPAPGDPETHARCPAARAAESIGRIGAEGTPAVVALLAELLEADDAGARYWAAISLERLGPKATAAVPALAKATRGPRRGGPAPVGQDPGRDRGPGRPRRPAGPAGRPGRLRPTGPESCHRGDRRESPGRSRLG